MNKKFTLILCCLLAWNNSFAQNVGIGTTNPTEKLHVEGNLRVVALGGVGNALVLTDNNGVLSRTALSGNATDVFTGAGTFVPISGMTDGWKLLGNTGTNPATNFVGTIDLQALAFRTFNSERMRIEVNGNIGVGLTTPFNKFDIAAAARTGTHAMSSALYVTGNFGAGANGVEFRHTNGTQGIGFGFNTIYATGSNATQDLGLASLSTGNLLFSTNALERMRILGTNGFVGIGIAAPVQRLDVQNGNARINNTFIGDVGHGANWGAFAHYNQASTNGYSLLASIDGQYTLINKLNTGTGYIGFRQSNIDMAVIDFRGNMGIGTTAPAANARLQVVGGAIMPQTGNDASSGIYFPTNPGGGGGDEAYIRHYVEAGENTKLVIANVNDFDDDISFRTGLTANERLQINGNGTVYINRGVFFDCNDCGGTGAGQYDLADGAGGNWGDLSIQGRVISTNSNLHLSPPGGNRVIINSAYRAAGGGTGTTGLDIEDGGIRMRKNYRWINRYGSTGGFGWGSQTHNLGNWDFCAIGHVGFRNTNSTTDEDDDVQCAVYPQAHADQGEGNLWDSFFTYQYNQRPVWFMYLEGFADTNATNCAASCINFD